MVTDDKVTARTYDLENNHNKRDERRSYIVLVVLVLMFVAFLVGLGMAHAPQAPTSGGNNNGQAMSNVGGAQPLASGQAPSDFDVNIPVGPVELPGTIGKPQKFLSGQGNTPFPIAGSPTTNVPSSPNTTPSPTNTQVTPNVNGSSSKSGQSSTQSGSKTGAANLNTGSGQGAHTNQPNSGATANTTTKGGAH